MDLWSVQRHPEAFRRPYELWMLCLLSAESSRPGGRHCFALKNNKCPRFLSKSFSPHPDALQCVLPRSGCGVWTLVGLIWAFRIAVPATRVKKLFFWTELFGAGREDCTTTSQPMEALLFFHGADFNTANLMERKCPHIQSFLAHCCFFISQLLFLYERPHIAVTTKKELFDFIRSSRISTYLLWSSI